MGQLQHSHPPSCPSRHPVGEVSSDGASTETPSISSGYHVHTAVSCFFIVPESETTTVARSEFQALEAEYVGSP